MQDAFYLYYGDKGTSIEIYLINMGVVSFQIEKGKLSALMFVNEK